MIGKIVTRPTHGNILNEPEPAGKRKPASGRIGHIGTLLTRTYTEVGRFLRGGRWERCPHPLWRNRPGLPCVGGACYDPGAWTGL